MFDFFGWLLGCLGFLFSSFFSTGLPPAPTPATTPAPSTPAPTTTPAPYCYCGVASRSKRITGGHETEVNEYPWMAFVLTSHGSMCGGSLISYRWVITAAHCAMVEGPDHIRVDLGQHALYDSTEAVLVRKDVIEVHHHPSFNLQQVSHDLALLKLKEGVNFLKHPHVRPICLLYPYYNNKNTYAGYEAVVSGWGMTGNTSPTSQVLMETEVDVLSNQQCKASGVPASMISDDHICARGDFENQGVCKGDSGGPLMTKGSGQSYELIGVSSWVAGKGGVACGSKTYPSVFARITEMQDWITETTKDDWTTCPRKD